MSARGEQQALPAETLLLGKRSDLTEGRYRRRVVVQFASPAAAVAAAGFTAVTAALPGAPLPSLRRGKD